MTLNELRDEILANPTSHRHAYQDLVRCCTTADGAVSLAHMDAHRAAVPARNPGGCDVMEGPCACGAWH